MVIFTKHALERMEQRDITRSEVKRALATGSLDTDHSGEHGEFKFKSTLLVVIGHVTETDEIVIMTTWRTA